jgi:hypothetical protein
MTSTSSSARRLPRNPKKNNIIFSMGLLIYRCCYNPRCGGANCHKRLLLCVDVLSSSLYCCPQISNCIEKSGQDAKHGS